MSAKQTPAMTFNPLDKFLESVQNFFKALEHLYGKKVKKDPDDEESLEVLKKIQRWHSRLRTMIIEASDKVKTKAGKELVSSFHDTLEPFYQRIMKMDTRVIFEIDHAIFTELDFKKIFSKAKEKVQTIMFKHLQVMCRNANLCCSTEDVPDGVMSKVYGISAKMAQAQKQGKKPDFGQIWNEASSIVHGSSEKDQMAIAKSMQDGGMQGLMNMVMGGAGGAGGASKTKKKKLSSKARKIRAKREKKRAGSSKLTGSKRRAQAREQAEAAEKKRTRETPTDSDTDSSTDSSTESDSDSDSD